MTTLRSTLLGLSLSVTALAAPPAGKPDGKKAAEQERTAALQLKGDAARGKDAYKVCAACHLDTGAGRADGTFPQLAGQHASVLIKQVADIRAGVRANPVMHPFSTTLTSAQELADVAAYLQTLPTPTDTQKGSGTELGQGQRLFEANCAGCHGKQGEGDAAKFVPRLSGQHYAYVLRQAQEIRDGKRTNGHQDMLKTVKKLGDKELSAVADYLARLSLPAAAAPVK